MPGISDGSPWPEGAGPAAVTDHLPACRARGSESAAAGLPAEAPGAGSDGRPWPKGAGPARVTDHRPACRARDRWRQPLPGRRPGGGRRVCRSRGRSATAGLGRRARAGKGDGPSASVPGAGSVAAVLAGVPARRRPPGVPVAWRVSDGRPWPKGAGPAAVTDHRPTRRARGPGQRRRAYRLRRRARDRWRQPLPGCRPDGGRWVCRSRGGSATAALGRSAPGRQR